MSPHSGTAALTKARQQADQQRAHGDAAFELIVDKARKLLTKVSPTDAWVILAHDITRQLDCNAKGPQFSAETLASVALHRAEATR